MRADSVAVVETGYAIDLPEAQWVERVCETAWAPLGIGEGCFAYLYDASSSELEVWSSTFARGAAERTDFDVASAVGRIKAILPESVIASLYDPAPPAGLASEYIDPDLPGMAELWGSALPANVTDVVGVRAGGLERRSRGR